MECSETKYKNNLDSAYDFAASQLMAADRDLYRLALYERDLHRRKALIALWTLITALESIPAQITESQMGLLRFKWWHDSLEQGQADQTQLLIALEHSIAKGLLDRAKLLTLIDHMQGEITLSRDEKLETIRDYQMQKGRLIAECLHAAHKDIFAALCLARAAGWQPEILEGAIQNHAPKEDIYAAKLSCYTKLLMQKIKNGKQVKLSPLDLIKLHFA